MICYGAGMPWWGTSLQFHCHCATILLVRKSSPCLGPDLALTGRERSGLQSVRDVGARVSGRTTRPRRVPCSYQGRRVGSSGGRRVREGEPLSPRSRLVPPRSRVVLTSSSRAPGFTCAIRFDSIVPAWFSLRCPFPWSKRLKGEAQSDPEAKGKDKGE